MKIEFDLPEFEKELSINIVIRRDGEVVYSTSSPSTVTVATTPSAPRNVVEDVKVNNNNVAINNDVEVQNNLPPQQTERKLSGNLMDPSLF